MSCEDNSCYNGTHFEGQCLHCLGTGEKYEFQWGPLYISFAKFWKPNLHKRYVEAGRPPQFSIRTVPLSKRDSS